VIFVDTGFFFALLSEKDPDHSRAVEVFESFSGRRLFELFLTTNHVVFETVTLARARAGHALAVEVGEMLYSEKLARVHHATEEEEREAFMYLRKYQDKEYSAVDCLSFVLMDKLGIREALSVDSDFGHRFQVRPGPR
jgi:predicted nucleic acid-binding protein